MRNYVNIYEYINLLIKEKLLIFITVLFSTILIPLITNFIDKRYDWPLNYAENYLSIKYKISPLTETYRNFY